MNNIILESINSWILSESEQSVINKYNEVIRKEKNRLRIEEHYLKNQEKCDSIYKSKEFDDDEIHDNINKKKQAAQEICLSRAHILYAKTMLNLHKSMGPKICKKISKTSEESRVCLNHMKKEINEMIYFIKEHQKDIANWSKKSK